MDVRLELSTDADAHIIQNFWSLYQHDVSQFTHSMPNRHGLFAAHDGVTTMEEHLESLAPWWREPDTLFPYVIFADGCPAGFNLIAARSRVPAGSPVDFIVQEFFVLHPYRGRGVAEAAALRGFDLHRGSWEVATWPEHVRAIRFWRRVIRGYDASAISEKEMDHHWGKRVVFRFHNETPQPD